MNTSAIVAIVVIELLLKGTAVLLAGLGGAAMLSKSSAAHRSLSWLGVFATLLLLPLALLVHPVWILPVHAALDTSSAPAAAIGAVPPLDASILYATSSSAHPGWHGFSLQQWLLVGYGCGVAAVLGFRLLGSTQLWSLHRTAIVDEEAQALADEWRKASRMRRPVRVLTSSRVTVPMTWGIWRTVILLPEGSGAWPAAELHAAMRHEFAHIRHFDAARRWLGTIVCALWWPHPLCWMASRAWRLEQERACDDAVLNSGGDAAAYARQLIAAARGLTISRFQTAAALVMAMPAGLEARLSSVMSDAVDRSPMRARSLLGIGAMTLAAMIGCVAFQAQSVQAAPAANAAAPDTAEKRAKETIIPKLEIREATIREAMELIAQKGGPEIVFTQTQAAREDARITLALTNIPVWEAIKYVAGLAELPSVKITYDDRWVTVVSQKAGADGSGGEPGNTITTEVKGSAYVAKPVGAANSLNLAGGTFVIGGGSIVNKPEGAAIKKARDLIIPLVNLREATTSDAVDYLRKKAIEVDPEKTGVTIVLKPGPADPAVDPRLTLDLHNVPLSEALVYVSELSNLKLHAEPNAIVIEPPNAGDLKSNPPGIEPPKPVDLK